MLNNKKGMAMVIVIAFVLMLLILGGAVLMVSTGHFGTSYYQIKRTQAFYTAEAAMQHALWRCRRGPTDGGYDLGAIPNPPGYLTDSITANNLTANIEIHRIGASPLGPGVPTPADTYPIVIKVDY